MIAGGTTKNLDMSNLLLEIKKYCKNVITLPGTGTDTLKLDQSIKVSNLADAVTQAVSESKKGDIILFSPSFTSFGLFNNEYDRNDQFVKLVKALK